jgi:hypothetical protein
MGHSEETQPHPDEETSATERKLRVAFGDCSAAFPTNFAWSAVHQDEWYRYKHDLYPGAVAFMQAVAEYHDIPLARGDVVVFSRPDVLYSHKIDFGRLQALGRQYASRLNDFAMLTRHKEVIGGHDPSDVFFITTVGFMISTWGRHAVVRDRQGFPEVPGRVADPTFAGVQGWLLHQASCRGNHVFFIANELQLHLHRLAGGYEIAVNGPGAGWVDPSEAISHGPLDLTANAVCAVGRQDTCLDSNRQSAFDVRGMEKVRLYDWSRGTDYFYVCSESAPVDPTTFPPLLSELAASPTDTAVV